MALMAYRRDMKTAATALAAVRDLDACRRGGLVAAARVRLGSSAAAAEWVSVFNLREANFGFTSAIWQSCGCCRRIRRWKWQRNSCSRAPIPRFHHTQTLTTSAHRYSRYWYIGMPYSPPCRTVL
jgi:hypothetical protein